MPIVDGSFRCTTSNIAIEHAIHHHCTRIIFCGLEVIVAHDAADTVATLDFGIAEAVDDAGRTIEQADKATAAVSCIIRCRCTRTLYRAAEDADIVDTTTAIGHAGDGAYLSVLADVNTRKAQVMYRAIGQGSKERCVKTSDGLIVTVKYATE